MNNELLTIYRRRMPHWRLVGSVYFVTWRLHQPQLELTAPERELIASALKYFNGKRYDLLAYVVMPDHVHLLIKPFSNHPLQELVRSWKSYTANQMQKEHSRRGKIWQEEYFDRIVRDEDEFFEKAQYILNNPSKTLPNITDYYWVWVKPDLNDLV